MNSGLIYIMGRCKPGYQPIIVVSGKRFQNNNVSLDILEKYLLFLFDWIQKNMLVPGHIENWLILLDLEDCTIATVPVA